MTTLAATQAQITKLVQTNPTAAAEKLNTFAKNVDSLSSAEGKVLKDLFSKLTASGMERATLRGYSNIAKFMKEGPVRKSDTEEAQEQLRYPRLGARTELEKRLSTFIRANSGDDDEDYFGALDGSNLGMHAYVLDGKAADTLLELCGNYGDEPPALDPKKHVVVAVMQTFDEPDIKALILDKATLRPVYANSGLNPFNMELDKDLPKSVLKDKRIYDGEDIDGFKAVAVLLSPGKEIDLKLKNKDDAAWKVSEWLDE